MFNYFLYRIGQAIALSLPIEIAYRVAVFFSDLHCIFAYKDRRAVTGNLKAIFPEKTDREIVEIRKNTFRNFAKYLVDFFRFSKLDSRYIEKNIKIVGTHYIDEALLKRKGAIILTAHIGNWELGGVVIALLGYPFWAVALSHKDPRVNDFFNFQRQSKGIKVVALEKAVKASLGVLKQNELIALLGDRNFSERGVVLDFFRKPMLFPVGPALLSLKTGAPVIPGFMVRNKDDSFTLKIERPIEFKPSGNKEKDLLELILQYKSIFEDYIRSYPDQWYMFREFWIIK